MQTWFAKALLWCASRSVGSDQRCSILSHERSVILSRGRTVAASPTEAETRVGIFGRHFPSSGCGAITNHAALPDGHTARGRRRRIARWICARRHHPRDERRNQRQPKSLGRADRRSSRHAWFSVPVSAVRVGAVHDAERPVERVNLPKLITSSECRPRRVRSQY